jgi:hypothetical protein
VEIGAGNGALRVGRKAWPRRGRERGGEIKEMIIIFR